MLRSPEKRATSLPSSYTQRVQLRQRALELGIQRADRLCCRIDVDEVGNAHRLGIHLEHFSPEQSKTSTIAHTIGDDDLNAACDGPGDQGKAENHARPHPSTLDHFTV